MPSPFAKYTGEQVQQINILPYTAQIAQNLGQGIASIGDAVAKYAKGQQERDELAQYAQGAVSKYVVQDLQNPEDKMSFKADDNAPAHSADLINLALKEGDGDIATGIAGMPLSKLRAWANLDTKWEKTVQQETENRFKEQGLANDARKVELAQEANRLAKKEVALKAAEAKRKREAEDDLKKKEAFVKSVSDTSGIPLVAQTKEQVKVVEEIGDIFRPDGTLIASNVQIRDAIPALGLNPKDVVTAEKAVQIKNAGADYAFDAVGRYLTQNENFKVSDNFSSAIQNGYGEAFIRSTFRQANALSLSKGSELKGLEAFFPEGFDGKINNPQKAFELAQTFLKNPQFVDYIKKQGVSTVPDGAAFNKAYYQVTGKDERTDFVVKEIPLTDIAREKMRFDELAKVAGGADKLPMSWIQYVSLQPDRFLPKAQVQLADGTVINVHKVGNTFKTDSELVGAGKGGLPETKAQLDIASADRWLRGFEKPQKFGNIVVQHTGGIQNFAGNWDTDYPILKTGFEDVKQTGEIANEMRKYVNKGFLSKVMDVEAKSKFDSLVLRATTYRKYFIAGGQETEPDAIRLFDIVGAMNPTRMVFTDAHLAAINAFESILRDKVVGAARQNGFRVAVSKGSESVDLKKIIANVQAENAKQGIK